MRLSGSVLWAVCIFGGFISGSIMFGSIIPKIFQNKNICEISDDRNPGAFNVFSECGIPLGMLCLSLDILKALIPVSFACRRLDMRNPLFIAVIAAPVLGHAIAPLHHFHGGKCISSVFGVLLALLPYNPLGFIALASLYIFFSTAVKINPTRIRSLVTFTVFGVFSLVFYTLRGVYPAAFGLLLISAVAALKHTKYFVPEEHKSF